MATVVKENPAIIKLNIKMICIFCFNISFQQKLYYLVKGTRGNQSIFVTIRYYMLTVTIYLTVHYIFIVYFLLLIYNKSTYNSIILHQQEYQSNSGVPLPTKLH